MSTSKFICFVNLDVATEKKALVTSCLMFVLSTYVLRIYSWAACMGMLCRDWLRGGGAGK